MKRLLNTLESSVTVEVCAAICLFVVPLFFLFLN